MHPGPASQASRSEIEPIIVTVEPPLGWALASMVPGKSPQQGIHALQAYQNFWWQQGVCRALVSSGKFSYGFSGQ